MVLVNTIDDSGSMRFVVITVKFNTFVLEIVSLISLKFAMFSSVLILLFKFLLIIF